MKIGVCGPIDRVDHLEELGFDQIELSIGAISEMDEAELAALKARLDGRSIELASGNCMFHGGLPLLYQDTGLEKAKEYLAMVMRKLKYLGITTAVFGSGGHRRMPEDMPAEKRHEIIRDVLVIMAEEAR